MDKYLVPQQPNLFSEFSIFLYVFFFIIVELFFF